MSKKLIIITLCLSYSLTIYSQGLAQFGTSTTTNCLSGNCLNGYGTCKRAEGQFTGQFVNGHPFKGILTIENFSSLKHYWNGIWDDYSGYDKKEIIDFQNKSFAGLIECNCLTKMKKHYQVTTRTETTTGYSKSSKDDITFETKEFLVNKTNQRVYIRCVNVVYSKVQQKSIFNDISFFLEPGEELDADGITFTHNNDFENSPRKGNEVYIGTYRGYPKKVTQFGLITTQNNTDNNTNLTSKNIEQTQNDITNNNLNKNSYFDSRNKTLSNIPVSKNNLKTKTLDAYDIYKLYLDSVEKSNTKSINTENKSNSLNFQPDKSVDFFGTWTNNETKDIYNVVVFLDYSTRTSVTKGELLIELDNQKNLKYNIIGTFDSHERNFYLENITPINQRDFFKVDKFNIHFYYNMAISVPVSTYFGGKESGRLSISSSKEGVFSK